VNTENEKAVPGFDDWHRENAKYMEPADIVSWCQAAWQAALQSLRVPPGLIETLRDHQRQIDEDGTEVGVNRQAVDEAVKILEASAPKAPQQVSNTPQDDPLSGWLVTEISAIDCEYRGDPSYTHDAYWMREAVIGFIEKHKSVIDVTPPQQQEQSGEVVEWQGPWELQIDSCMTGREGVHAFVNAKAIHLEYTDGGYRWKLLLPVPTKRNKSLRISPATPTATASQESAPGQEAVRFIDVWKKYMPAPMPEDMQTYRWCETFWKEGRQSISPPTSPAIAAAMVIKQAAEIASKKQKFAEDILGSDDIGESESDAWKAEAFTCKTIAREIAALTPANAEAELEALMKQCVEYAFEAAGKGWAHGAPEAIVRRVLDEMKGE
jgi:hypothetical protein